MTMMVIATDIQFRLNGFFTAGFLRMSINRPKLKSDVAATPINPAKPTESLSFSTPDTP
jgi:hypothetical protein